MPKLSIATYTAEEIAARLAKLRKQKDLSQRQLALGICTPAYVSRIEKGERLPSLQIIHRLAERLDVEPEALTAGKTITGRRNLQLQKLSAATPKQLKVLVKALELMQASEHAPQADAAKRDLRALISDL